MPACRIRWYKLLCLAFAGSFLTACQSIAPVLSQDTAPPTVMDKKPQAEQAETGEKEPSLTPETKPLPLCKPVEPKPVICRTQVIYQPVKIDDKLTIGEVETIVLPGIDNLALKARIDTGAETSSLHITSSRLFERDGKRWVAFTVPLNENDSVTLERPLSRTVLIKQKENMESMRRMVVVLSVRLGTLERNVEFTLADREGFEFPALIGRNFLKDMAIVDVGHEFLATGSGVSPQS
ncbi:RimK/LysX family protein [Parendozoicomonas haliclonae]|uniref:Retropepsin-like aspartic endopeptidase domain-containing protein n=1 Tax=Parendozoicomonas haliclonae TaxID=1960125 RepID=A0A1X7ALZ8_9GAMM|nr:RimK/LysX family protein [Parendozoicomonas haliclonae]SMA48654.1 hypothetical protein EHSB41UT_02832 [Parendozoicomonas haliclonae]